MTPGEVGAMLVAAGAKSAEHGVYDIGPDGFDARRLLSFQVQLLETVRQLPGTVFLQYDEDPQEWELGEWPSHGHNMWEIPPSMASDVLLESYLEAGNWQLYVARQSAGPKDRYDAFRGDIGERIKLLETHGVSVWIDAWHDNTEWRVILPKAI